MSMSMLRQGRLIPVPPVDKALRYLESRERPSTPSGRRAVIGDPVAVRAGIEQVAGDYGAEEVMVVTITFDHEARRRSYELIAEAFDLAAAGRSSTRLRRFSARADRPPDRIPRLHRPPPRRSGCSRRRA